MPTVKNTLNQTTNNSPGYQIDPIASGYGMRGMFRPSIALESDNGAGPAGGVGGNSDPEPEDVSGLKSALQKEREARKSFESKFTSLQELYKDIDPEKYKQFEALQAREETRNKEFSELRQNLEAGYTKQIGEYQTKLQGTEAKLTELTNRYEIEKAYGAVGGSIEAGEDGVGYFDLFYTSVNRNLKRNENGELEVMDADGVRRYSQKDAKKPMALQEFFESYKLHPVLGNCFPMKNPPKGGGANPSARDYGRNPDLSQMSRSERLNYLDALEGK
jgi:hypothetical protein